MFLNHTQTSIKRTITLLIALLLGLCPGSSVWKFEILWPIDQWHQDQYIADSLDLYISRFKWFVSIDIWNRPISFYVSKPFYSDKAIGKQHFFSLVVCENFIKLLPTKELLFFSIIPLTFLTKILLSLVYYIWYNFF